jgi:hypothetical protein
MAAILNKQNCLTKKCNTCAFYQMESSSVDAKTVIAVCKPNYLVIGSVVALIIAAPYLYKKFKK